MADIGKSLKTAWLKGMEAIGNTASNIASNTKYKVNEMNVINRRREILSDFGARAYELWQKGVTFPEELENDLKELSHLDEQLNALRTERLAGVKTAAEQTEDAHPADTQADEAPAEESDKTSGVPTIDVPAQEDAPEEEKPLEDPIDELVRRQQDSQALNDKVDKALDAVGDTMNKMGGAIDSAIASMTDALQGQDKDHKDE